MDSRRNGALHAALIVQIVVDVATCFVIADLARRIASERAAKVAFGLAALCPFFANYAAVALTETWAIFFSALAMDAAVAGFDQPSRRTRWVICGVALASGIVLPAGWGHSADRDRRLYARGRRTERNRIY